MKTEQLIAALAADQTRDPGVAQRLTLAMGGATLVSLGLLATLWGVRDGIAPLLMTSVGLKTWVPAGLGVAAFALARAVARPESRGAGPWTVVLGFAAFMIVWFALAMWREGMAGLMAALASPNLVPCIVSISLLSLPGVGAALWAMRAGAATDRARAGLAVGLLGAATGAMAYSLHCPEDVLLFCLPAYGVTMTGVALLGMLISRRLLRW